MTPEEFRGIRAGLLMTQAELAQTLGYGHKMRVSEFECGRANIPRHIERAMTDLWEGRTPRRKSVRDWHRQEGWA